MADMGQDESSVSLPADQVMETLASLKAQIARLEAQLPTSLLSRPMGNGLPQPNGSATAVRVEIGVNGGTSYQNRHIDHRFSTLR